MKSNRIEWIDIFRGILIYLVVLGHSNNIETLFWIYSFHMSAFFIISGYTLNLDKYDLTDFIKHKFKKLMIPFATVNVFFWIIHLFADKIGIHNFLFATTFDKNSLIYVFKYFWTIDLGAAMWFLYVLFFSSICLKLIYDLIKRKYNTNTNIKLLIAISILFLIYYYLFYSVKEALPYNMDLIPAAMFFITLGMCFKSFGSKVNKKIYYAISIICTIFSIYYGFILRNFIEWSSRSFPSIPIFLLASISGFILIKNIALLVNFIFNKLNKKEIIISYIGRNSIEVLLYHFLGFKIVYYIFYKAGIISYEQVGSLTPAYGDFWLTLFTSILATALALIISKGLKVIKMNIIKFFDKNKKKIKISSFVAFVVLFIISVVKNFLIQGIMCNDEVLLRINGQFGIKNFLHAQIVDEEIKQGRILGAFGNFKVLSFLSDNIIVFRTIGILVILFTLFLLGYLVYKIFKNKWFSIFVFVMALAFIPVTFEPSIPNAYIIVICEPLILIMSSLIFYLDYFSTKKKSKLFLSLFFFFWGCCLYEFVVTYLVLFIIITYLKSDKMKSLLKSWISAIYKTLPHILTAVFYLFCYVMQRKIFPTQYSGTKLALTSFGKMINVFKIEFLSSLPGYYLFNDKYKYLYNIYKQPVVSNINTYIILFLFAIAFIFLITYIYKKNSENNHNKKLLNNNFKSIIIMLTLILYMFLPVLPNSLTELYQNTVSTEFFISIPVSIFLYFSLIVLISFVIWNYLFKYKKILIVLLVFFTIIGINVQLHNNVYANQQYNDYKRFVNIEELFKISYWKYIGEQKIMAPSLYETKNTLAIEPTHWTRYNRAINVDSIIVEGEFDKPDWYIEMQDDNSFYMYNNNSKYYLTKNNPMIDSTIVLRKIDKTDEVGIISECFWDENDFKFYKIVSAK